MQAQNSTGVYSDRIIVDINPGKTPYSTIQAGINAAAALVTSTGEPQSVVIRAGTYTENLVFADDVSLSGASRDNTIINGHHTLADGGDPINISFISFVEATINVPLFTEGAGPCEVNFEECYFTVNDAFLFNRPSQAIVINISNTEDLSVSSEIGLDSAGCSTGVFSSTLCNGATPSTVSDFGISDNSLIRASCILSGICSVENSEIRGTVTLDAGCSFYAYDSRFTSGADEAFIIDATATADINRTIIDSTRVAGVITGAGTVNIDTVTYANESTVTAGTINQFGTLEVGDIQVDRTQTGALVADQGDVGILPLDNGELIIGSTGAVPVVGTLTAGSGIAITNGAGSITISSTAPLTWTTIGVDGALAQDTAYINTKVALLTVSLPATATLGSVFIIQGFGAGGWILTQGAGQQVIFGNQATTVGVGGSLASTNANDSVSFVCVTADLTWSVYASIGNLTVV